MHIFKRSVDFSGVMKKEQQLRGTGEGEKDPTPKVGFDSLNHEIPVGIEMRLITSSLLAAEFFCLDGGAGDGSRSRRW